MKRLIPNPGKEARYFNVNDVEPEVLKCSIRTCPETLPVAYEWRWAECAACRLKTCPDHLRKIDEELFCESCAQHEKPEAKAA